MEGRERERGGGAIGSALSNVLNAASRWEQTASIFLEGVGGLGGRRLPTFSTEEVGCAERPLRPLPLAKVCHGEALP